MSFPINVGVPDTYTLYHHLPFSYPLKWKEGISQGNRYSGILAISRYTTHLALMLYVFYFRVFVTPQYSYLGHVQENNYQEF